MLFGVLQSKTPSNLTADPSSTPELHSPTLSLPEQLQLAQETALGVDNDITSHMEAVVEPLSMLRGLMEKATQVERCKSYLQCLDRVEKLRYALAKVVCSLYV